MSLLFYTKADRQAMALRLRVARKEHRCTLCGRSIAVGTRYWVEFGPGVDRREHGNCLNFQHLPALPEGFNQNRKKYR